LDLIFSYGGTNDLREDWEQHQERIAMHCRARDCAVLPVRDHATVLRHARFYFRHVMPVAHIKQLFGLFAVPFIIAVFVIHALSHC
jgi:hypothetical protein